MSDKVDNHLTPRRRSIRAWFRDLRVSRKLMVVIVVHLLHAAILLVVTAYGMKALSASRAYVEGEGLWSKAQKEGTLHLIAYAEGGPEADYDAFLANLDVTLGDRQARLEMDKSHPDDAVIRDGFLRGKLHPDDVDDLVWLYRNFGKEPHLAKAIAIWGDADVEIQALLDIGGNLRAAVQANDTAAIATLKAQAYASDARLSILEDDFSRSLGDGVRWLTRVVNAAAIGLTVVFVGLALVISATAARQITRSLNRLNATAQAVSAGDLTQRVGLDGRDEVAAVGRTFDAMAGRIAAMVKESGQAAAAKAEVAAQEREIQRLAELDAFRTQFINMASHELRTPLTPLRAQLHVLRLRRGATYTPEERRSLDIAERNVERLARLVEDLLQVARYQAGRMVLDRKLADVHDVVSEAADTFQELAKSRGIALQLTTAGDGSCFVDAHRISQVAYNLLANAMKFTPPGGSVHVDSEAKDDGVVVRITDTGLGIRPEDVPKLFQPFIQVHATPVQQPGSGLGLYICRAIVGLHGGTIEATSPGLGQGVTVTVHLPRGNPDPAKT
ncbi:MAG: HAMP domain-containing sensor histidine kinase [Candidatus Thermoplasmatota archaeon]